MNLLRNSSHVLSFKDARDARAPKEMITESTFAGYRKDDHEEPPY